jgi:hypothetical protein
VRLKSAEARISGEKINKSRGGLRQFWLGAGKLEQRCAVWLVIQSIPRYFALDFDVVLILGASLICVGSLALLT